ncbi:hypothetical protein T484DRAFT_1770736, partial [Baffinella frigidus]
MGCGKSKEARAVAPLIPADRAPTATPGGGEESSRDQPHVLTMADASSARPRAVVAEGRAACATYSSGEGSGAALPPGTQAPGSGHPPAHRPTLPPPVEAHGRKLGAFASMVRTMPLVVEAQLERSLEDVTGPIDPQQVLRALYMEHCDGPEALERFASSYGFETCAKEEFECVVGEEGVDKETWTLVEDAAPKVASEAGGGVRDARTLSELLRSEEVKMATLGAEEVVALRLLTGPMHEVYNLSLRGGGVGAKNGGPGGKGVRFATTCLLIGSGLRKLARIGAALQGGAVYRGLAGGGE